MQNLQKLNLLKNCVPINSLKTPRVSFQHVLLYSKKNSEPKVNDAKAQPATANLKLGDVSDSGPVSTEVEKQLRSDVNKACSEIANLMTKNGELEDKFLRALADSENLRARMTKQINDSKIYAIQSFCKDLTEIEDVLRLAIESVSKEELQSDNKHLKQLYEGLTMTQSRLLQVFKIHGLTQINPLDAKFNPNEHEAVVHTEQEGKESGTVIFVSKLGYKLHDRVVRPAVVGVAK